MKTLHQTAVLVFTFLICIAAAGCKKEKDKIHIAGFDINDAAGNLLGHYGPDDNDWTFNNTLSDHEVALFDFSTDVSLENTLEAVVFDNMIHTFPNPCSADQFYHISVSEATVVKLVIVNSKLEVLMKQAFKIMKGANSIKLNYGNRSLFADMAGVRLYYSFCAQNKPNYKSGYGDIKICSNTNYTECF